MDGNRTGFRMGRLADSGPAPGTGENFNDLLSFGATRIEHIVSSDTPDTAPQVQDHHEWVLLSSGSAALEVAGQLVRLEAGDWVWIPGGVEHRVLSTAKGSEWLAVHISGEA